MRALTLAPLPNWKTLLHAFCHPSNSYRVIAGPWCKKGEQSFWFSRSAWSLVAIVNCWQKVTGKTEPTFWIPGYFCNGSLKPLRCTHANLIFYPITAKLEPDYNACREMSKHDSPDIFLLTHYFGESANAAKASEFCAHTAAWLVEDAAHVTIPIKGVGNHGDFVLYSPHKSLPIPDGALLVARPNGPGRKELSEFLATGFQEACNGVIKEVGGKPGFPALWLVKRILQKFGARPLRVKRTDFEHDDSDTLVPHPRMTEVSRRLLAALIYDLGSVHHERRLLLELWNYLIGNTPGLKPVNQTGPDRYSPYMAGFECDSDSRAKTLFIEFQRLGLPVTTWPDLPPEVIQNSEFHKEALRLRYNRVYLAVHQNLNLKQVIDRVPNKHQPCLLKSKISANWDDVTHEQWNGLIDGANCSNLLQSWAYGEAKKKCEGWQVQRAVFSNKNGPIAIVQVLKKTYFEVFKVYRVNRGPIFMKSASLEEQAGVMELLGRLADWRRGQLLLIAPELESNAQNAILMAQLNYRQFQGQAWSSAYIDLRVKVDAIRKNLDGKWRNMLNTSEKQGLLLEVGHDDQLFEWMLDRYSELIAEKRFTGIPFPILRALWKISDDHTQFIIMRAVHNGESVSCIFVLKYGATATYLIGWNGNQGRQLKAHQFLLWNAIVELKQRGCHWFDLGGIDVYNTPGISEFKLGLNGVRYELIGEYLKY